MTWDDTKTPGSTLNADEYNALVVEVKDGKQIANITDMDKQSFTNLLKNGDFESWSAGTAAAPDGWSLIGSNVPTSARSSTSKICSYSALVSFTGNNSTLIQDIITYKSYLNDRIITIAAWVKTSVADDVRLIMTGNYIGGSGQSAPHSGGGDWELLTFTTTMTFDVGGTTTSIQIGIRGNTNATTAHIDGMILVEGSVCPAFSPHPTDQIPRVLTSAPTDAGANGETRWYAVAGAGGARRMYMSNGTDWKYQAIST